jgi:hypothetical protein
MSLFRVFLRCVRMPTGYLESVCSSGSPAFSWGLDSHTARPRELLRTDSAQDRCQYGRMKKKKRQLNATARTTIAGIKREMQKPRLAGSVRDDPRYQVVLAAEEPTRSG